MKEIYICFCAKKKKKKKIPDGSVFQGEKCRDFSVPEWNSGGDYSFRFSFEEKKSQRGGRECRSLSRRGVE